MSITNDNLWNLTLPGRQVDPDALAAALIDLSEWEARDFRTRLLIRDSLNALKAHWGHQRFASWLATFANREQVERVLQSDLGPVGFWSLEKRLMKPTRPEIVEQLLRELGQHVRRPVRISIGGSIALILTGTLQRATEDIDLVDEIPGELRAQHDVLNEIASRYGLRLTHFQSHFLPTGWENRVRSLGRYGELDVFLVDACDVFVSKLFSARTKDLDDLRMMAANFDKATVTSRVLDFAKALRAEPDLASHAEKNWYIVYGDRLPS